MSLCLHVGYNVRPRGGPIVALRTDCGIGADGPGRGARRARRPPSRPRSASRGRLRRRPPNVLAAPAGLFRPDARRSAAKDLKARKVETRLSVEVQVNGRGPYHFVVDSGADTSVVGLRIARDLQLPLGTPAILNGMTGTQPRRPGQGRRADARADHGPEPASFRRLREIGSRRRGHDRDRRARPAAADDGFREAADQGRGRAAARARSPGRDRGRRPGASAAS